MTCPRCDQPLYPRLVRRTDDGWIHVTCPPRTCGACPATLPARNTTGYCRTCYERRRWAGQLWPTEPAPAKPCPRCGIGTAGLCDDCIDVAADLREVRTWAA